jgi:hypothetical protein
MSIPASHFSTETGSLDAIMNAAFQSNAAIGTLSDNIQSNVAKEKPAKKVSFVSLLFLIVLILT